MWQDLGRSVTIPVWHVCESVHLSQQSVLCTHLSSTTEDPKAPSVDTALKAFMYYGRLSAHLQQNVSSFVLEVLHFSSTFVSFYSLFYRTLCFFSLRGICSLSIWVQQSLISHELHFWHDERLRLHLHVHTVSLNTWRQVKKTRF